MYYAKHSSMNGIIICIGGIKGCMSCVWNINFADKTTAERALLPLFQTFFYVPKSVQPAVNHIIIN
jgi:hypothetical protein